MHEASKSEVAWRSEVAWTFEVAWKPEVGSDGKLAMLDANFV